MEQLIALVAEKAGIDQEQARTAVTTVMGFLKQKLPAGMAGQLDKLASGEGGEGGGAMGAIEKGIGGLFGK
jgi:hypothetical protein